MTLNTPRAMMERLAFACFLGLLIAAIGITWLGVIFGLQDGDARLAALGLAGLLLVGAVRSLGYKHLHFRECADSLEFVEGDDGCELEPVLAKRARAFAETLAAIEALQQRIADGGGDVWAVQQLRHDASAMLAADPALREIFGVELARHPELA